MRDYYAPKYVCNPMYAEVNDGEACDEDECAE